MIIRTLIAVLLVAGLAGCNAKPEPTARQQGQSNWDKARAGVMFSLARQQYEQGNLVEARKSIDGALALEPANTQIHLLSAKIAIEQGKLEPAETELRFIRTADPKMAEADYLSGVVYQRWQRPDAALEFYTSASAKAPAELPYLLARAEMLVRVDNRAEALRVLQEQMAYFENSAAIRDAAGQILVQEGQYRQAVDTLRQASILAPDEPSIREHLAMAMFYAKNYSEAGFVLERLVKDERYASRADLLLALGECQMATDRVREARDTFDAVSQLQSATAAAWLNLAKASLKLEDLRRAELSARKAMALEPQSGEANLLMGYVRLKQIRLDEALAAFRKASTLDAKDTVSLCMCGYVLERQGKFSLAMEYYAKALKLKPDDPLASTLMAQLGVQE